jgi:O-antigen ligase
MPPKLALLICILFILVIFIGDIKRKRKSSLALWVPLIWMLIIGSRYVSQWLNLSPPIESPDDYLEGSPIDRNVFLGLIMVGLFILFRRRISWSQIFQRNAWILFFFFYGGISIFWSDFEFVSFKRWIKAVGDVVMVLIVLTEPDPIGAVKILIRRCAFLLVPLSGLFIKYYPELGRGYSRWTWEPFYTGVTNDKNALGSLCMIFGLFFSWNLLTMWRNRDISLDRKEVFIHALFLVMILWLLNMARSATSLIGLIIGVSILVGMTLPNLKGNVKHTGFYILYILLILLTLELSFNVIQNTIASLGRDKTLTGRTELWEELIAMDTNPLVGTGYESFWLGDRARKFWEKYYWHPNQAHNGYLETYLNLGWIGVLLLTGVLFSCYRTARRTLIDDFGYGIFRMAFLAVALVYNITEAGFKGLHPMWFIFLVIAVQYPRSSGLEARGEEDASGRSFQG